MGYSPELGIQYRVTWTARKRRVKRVPDKKSSGLLLCSKHCKLFIKPLNSATTADKALFPSVKRVTTATDIQVQIMSASRTCFNHITARAGCSNFSIGWVDIFFHTSSPFIQNIDNGLSSKHYSKIVCQKIAHIIPNLALGYKADPEGPTAIRRGSSLQALSAGSIVKTVLSVGNCPVFDNAV